MNIPDEQRDQIARLLSEHEIWNQENLGYYRTRSTCACGESWVTGDHDEDPDFYEEKYRHMASAVIPVIAEWARKEALEEAIEAANSERLVDETGDNADEAYNQAIADAKRAIRDLVEGADQ